MKKAIIILIVAILCTTSLFAIIKLDYMVTDEFNSSLSPDKGDRQAIGLYGGTYWTEERMFKQQGFSFSVLTEAGFTLSWKDEFTRYGRNNGKEGHNDISLATLAGVKYVPTKNLAFFLSGGLKLTRIGYYGLNKVSDVTDWDSFVSVISFGLLGGKPSRKLEVVADLRAYFLYFGIGAQVGYSIWQNKDEGFKDKTSISLFAIVGDR